MWRDLCDDIRFKKIMIEGSNLNCKGILYVLCKLKFIIINFDSFYVCVYICIII